MIRLCIAVIAVWCVAAASAAASAAAAPPATLVPGQLTVGLSMPSEGFQVGVVNGTQVIYARGLEIDLSRELARRLELGATRFFQSPFGDVLAAGPKPWDLAVAEVTITARRSANVDFSVPYMRVDQGVLLSQYIKRTPRSLAGLRRLQLCAQKGSTGAAMIRRRIKPVRRTRRTANVDNLMLALQVGRCDAVVYDLPALATLNARAPRRYGPLAGAIRTGERYGIVLPKGSALKPPVDAAVKAMLADGTLARLQRTWLDVNTAGLRVLE